ncbi:hypothetical protein ACPCHT_27590 [Nucisporomicrobium flavum]|uniref:hypothetical protein n=1 Tax=Nucisporomicrobium flavum TaxID=2785915 RepID=UPI0018F75C6D|nr:hypothetical protein [Nucisporomicrobium flavum]
MTDTTQPDPTPGNPEEDHPAQEAHGGSMAPGLVDDTGHQTPDEPPQADEE